MDVTIIKTGRGKCQYAAEKDTITGVWTKNIASMLPGR